MSLSETFLILRRTERDKFRNVYRSFEIILLQTTKKENNWKTEETLERAAVTVETEGIKGSNA